MGVDTGRPRGAGRSLRRAYLGPACDGPGHDPGRAAGQGHQRPGMPRAQARGSRSATWPRGPRSSALVRQITKVETAIEPKLSGAFRRRERHPARKTAPFPELAKIVDIPEVRFRPRRREPAPTAAHEHAASRPRTAAIRSLEVAEIAAGARRLRRVRGDRDHVSRVGRHGKHLPAIAAPVPHRRARNLASGTSRSRNGRPKTASVRAAPTTGQSSPAARPARPPRGPAPAPSARSATGRAG